MKKKLVILAMLAAVMAFAQKPANIGKVEYLLLKVNATTPYGVEYVDELGSKRIRIEMKTLEKTYVMRITQKWPRTNEVQWAVLDYRDALMWVNVSHTAFFSVNPQDGGENGLVCFDFSVSRGDFIPSAECKLAGELVCEYDENLGQHVVKSGHGTIAGFSNPKRFAAQEALAPATLSLQSNMLPAWGTWTLSRFRGMTRNGDVTNDQIKAILKK